MHEGKVRPHSPGAAWRQAAADPDPGGLSFCQFQGGVGRGLQFVGRAIPVFPDLGDWKEQHGQAPSAAASGSWRNTSTPSRACLFGPCDLPNYLPGVPSTFHRPNAFKEAETFRSRSIFGQRDEKMGRIEAASQEAKSLKQPLTELSTPSTRPGRPRRDGRPPPGCVPDSATKSARGGGRGDGEAGCQALRRLPTVYTKKPNRNLNADGCRLGAPGASATGCAGPRVWLQVGGEHRA